MACMSITAHRCWQKKEGLSNKVIQGYQYCLWYKLIHIVIKWIVTLWSGVIWQNLRVISVRDGYAHLIPIRL